jgi:hypothetical protein
MKKFFRIGSSDGTSPDGGTRVSPLKGLSSFSIPDPALTRWARTNVAAPRLGTIVLQAAQWIYGGILD